MKKEKAVYLFGAGAAIPWKGPKTSDLTRDILNSGFYCSDGKTRVTKRIFEVLLSNFEEADVNFETIMNVLEELIALHSSKDYKRSNSFLFPFIETKDSLDDIYNFKVKGGKVKHGFSLKIPHYEELEGGKIALNGQTEKQFYLQLLYARLLTTISQKISSYAYHTAGVSKIFSDENQLLNQNFHKWISTQIELGFTTRLYTLNYERLFSVILKKNNINIFEGAECEAEIAAGENIRFDLKRILTDFDCNCHYNLHGSSFWEIETRNHHQLPSVQYSLTGSPNLSCNLWEQPVMQMEKGTTINPSNIITGYQKTQKTSISPFRQMQFSLDRDCLEADRMFIIGYSFGDVHINECIKNLLINNPSAQITIIDPYFKKNGMDIKIGIELLSNSEFPLSPTNIDEKTFSFLEGRIKVHEEFFNEYLNII